MARKSGAQKECDNAPNCPGTLPSDSEHKKCAKCRSRRAAWLKRPAYDVMRYVTSLNLRQARMQEVTDDRDLTIRPMFYDR